MGSNPIRGTTQPQVWKFMTTICNNWIQLIEQYDHLIDYIFVDDKGQDWKFCGIMHGSDDYYYVMKKHGTPNHYFFSCVGDLISGWKFALKGDA